MGTDAPLAQNFAHLLATDRMSAQHMPRFACHANPVDSISQPTVSHGLDPSHPPDIIHSALRIATPHPPTQRMRSQTNPAHAEHEHAHLAHAQRPLTDSEAVAWSQLAATSDARLDATPPTADSTHAAYVPQGHLAWRNTCFVPHTSEAAGLSAPSSKSLIDSLVSTTVPADTTTPSVPVPTDIDERQAELKAEVRRLENALAAARVALQDAERSRVDTRIVAELKSTSVRGRVFVSTAHRPQLSPAQRRTTWCSYCHAHGHTIKMGCEERFPCCHCGAADHRGEACPTRPLWPLSNRSRKRLRQAHSRQPKAVSTADDNEDSAASSDRSGSSARELYAQQLLLWVDPAKRRHRLPPASPVPTYKDFKHDAPVRAAAVTPKLDNSPSDATSSDPDSHHAKPLQLPESGMVEFTCPRCQQLHNGSYTGTVVCERQGCLNVMCLPNQPIIAPDATLPTPTSDTDSAGNVTQPHAVHQGESLPQERSAQKERTGQACLGKIQVGNRVALNADGQAVDSSYSWRLDPLTPLVHGTVISVDFAAGTVRVQSDLPDRADSDYDPKLLVTLPPLPVGKLPDSTRQQEYPGPGCYMRDGSGRFLRRKTFARHAGDDKEPAGYSDLLVHRSNPGCSVRGCTFRTSCRLVCHCACSVVRQTRTA